MLTDLGIPHALITLAAVPVGGILYWFVIGSRQPVIVKQKPVAEACATTTDGGHIGEKSGMSLAGWALALILGFFAGGAAGFFVLPLFAFTFGLRRWADGEWIWQNAQVSELGIKVVVITALVVGTAFGLLSTAGIQG